MFLFSRTSNRLKNHLSFDKRKRNFVKKLFRILVFLASIQLFFTVSVIQASDKTLDIVKLPLWASSTSDNHKKAVIERALELTIPGFGDYTIIQDTPKMNRYRSLQSIQEGVATNIHIIPKTKGWDKKTFQIKIPIRRGILSYRLILTAPNSTNLFNEVRTLNQLKYFRVGVNKGSSTIHVLQEANFNIIPTDSFSSLHSMLKNNRMDYLLRGPHEIFDEGERTTEQYKDFTTVSGVALYSPLPTYVYVSEKHPKLAKRLHAGLIKMQSNGDLKRLFYYYFGEFLKKADLKNRHIIYLENKSVSESYLEEYEEYWYTPDEEPVNFSTIFENKKEEHENIKKDRL